MLLSRGGLVHRPRCGVAGRAECPLERGRSHVHALLRVRAPESTEFIHGVFCALNWIQFAFVVGPWSYVATHTTMAAAQKDTEGDTTLKGAGKPSAQEALAQPVLPPMRVLEEDDEFEEFEEEGTFAS